MSPEQLAAGRGFLPGYNKIMSIDELRAPTLVTDQEGLLAMAQHLSHEPAFGIDTESNSLHAYQERVCLIQISSRTCDFVVDPFCFESLDALGSLFADEQIQKVFHAGDYDLACLKRDYGFSFLNLFDTMLAASSLGEPNIGLAALLEKYLGVFVDKKYQRADWGARPLKPEMLNYAQNDSHYLLDLRDALSEQLRNTEWYRIVLEDSQTLALNTPPQRNHEESIWQVKGANELKPPALSLLQALNHLRETLAEQADKPPFKILSDRALIEIAQTQPHYFQELTLLPSLSPGQTRRFGPEIMRTVEKWRKSPPSVETRRWKRISQAELRRRDQLLEWRKETGALLGLPSNIVLPKELVHTIASVPPADLEALREQMASSPTRYSRFGQEIYELIKRE